MHPDTTDSAPVAESTPPPASVDWTAPPVSWTGNLSPEHAALVDMLKG